MYVCIYTRIYINIYIYICIYVCIYCICIGMCMNIGICIRTYMYIFREFSVGKSKAKSVLYFPGSIV